MLVPCGEVIVELSKYAQACDRMYFSSESSQRQTIPYWPEIDGLRTIAVVAVLVFHLEPRLLQGGFVGVDIFFVISGYLITWLLYHDIRTNKLSIVSFYQRRIARIAPAAVTVIIGTIAAAWFLYSAQDLASVGANAVAATLSLINIKLLYQGDYFQISPDAQPLLHYWSLAVEEQFYLVFPLFIFVITKITNRVIPVLLACGFISFGACILLTPSHPIASFYLLPTRAWELLAGATLAVFKHDRRLEPQFAALLPFGLILLLVSILLIREEGFPGWIAAVPVLGSALTIAGIGSYRGRTARALSHPLMVFVGKRSYSLYLWHWPIFSFADYSLYNANPFDVLLVKLGLTALATLITYAWIEKPFRASLNIPRRRLLAFGGFAAIATTIALTGNWIRSEFYFSADPRDISTGGISISRGTQSVVVVGDSEGAMYGYELASLARKMNFRLNILAAAGRNELPEEPNTLWPNVSDFLSHSHPDLVILVQDWSDLLIGHDSQVSLTAGITSLLQSTKAIAIITQPPKPPTVATRHDILGGVVRPPFLEDPLARERRAAADKLLDRYKSKRVQIINVSDLFQKADGSINVVAPDGRLAYQDSNHLSSSGTRLVRERLKSVLQEALQTTSATFR